VQRRKIIFAKKTTKKLSQKKGKFFLYNKTFLPKTKFMEIYFLIFALCLTINLILLSIMIVHQRKKPQFMLLWTLIIVILPIFGFLLYTFYGLSLNKKIKKTLKAKKLQAQKIFEKNNLNLNKTQIDIQKRRLTQSQNKTSEKDDDLKKLQQYIKNIGGSEVCDCKTQIFCHSKDKIKSLKTDIKNASKSVDMEYYIFQNDKIGREILFLLCKKAKQGVQVNLIYDSVGSKKTPKKYFAKLSKAGGQVKEFFPPVLGIDLLNPQYNFRNHRKIVVVDDRIGYFGGMNICLDSVNGKELRPWKDIHYRLQGECVAYLKKVFVADFLFLGGKISQEQNQNENEDKRSKKVISKNQKKYGGEIQIFSSGPEERLEKSKDALIETIYMAKKKICIQTPYFIPDGNLLCAIKTASLSGVDVTIMLPQKQDRKVLQTVGLYYASHLCDMGVKFLMYNGFLHSKLLIVDDKFAFGGSSNFDNRSFSLNFEINGIFYDKNNIKKLSDIWAKDAKNSHFLTKDILKKEKIYKTSVSITAQLLSPFL